MTKLIDVVLLGLAIVGHRLGIYGWWHRVRRELDDRVYAEIPVFVTIEDAEAAATDRQRLVWRKDGARVFWDLISPPGRWWTRLLQVSSGVWEGPSGRSYYLDDHAPAGFDHDLVKLNNDCDEAATFLAAALQAIADAGAAARPSSQAGTQARRRMAGPMLLQVVWRNRDGKLQGHHLCIYKLRRGSALTDGRWYAGGNWGVLAAEVPSTASDAEAIANLAKLVAKPGGRVIHAHTCADPATLRGWRRVKL